MGGHLTSNNMKPAKDQGPTAQQAATTPTSLQVIPPSNHTVRLERCHGHNVVQHLRMRKSILTFPPITEQSSLAGSLWHLRFSCEENKQQCPGLLTQSQGGYLQNALAQMEVNAAAAMARFKNFRTPAAVKELEKDSKEEATLVPSVSDEPLEAALPDPTTEAAAEVCAGTSSWDRNHQSRFGKCLCRHRGWQYQQAKAMVGICWPFA